MEKGAKVLKYNSSESSENESDEELVIAETVEEFVALEAFEHSGEELTDSRSMHFKHGGTNSSRAALIC